MSGIAAKAGSKEAQLAAQLLAAWRDPARTVSPLDPALRPANEAEAVAVQQAVAAGLGRIGGWKVGRPAPDKPLSCSPMPLDNIHAGPAHLSGARFTSRLLEAEICVVMGRDLPEYGSPYTREQIIEAIDTVRPGIEVLQLRFAEPDGLDPLTALADSLAHGAYVYGPPVADWRSIDFEQEIARLLFDGDEEMSRRGNPGGDMIEMLVWLANKGSHWAGGLKSGQVVTTGSWTGKTPVGTGVMAEARFANAGAVTVDFRP